MGLRDNIQTYKDALIVDAKYFERMLNERNIEIERVNKLHQPLDEALKTCYTTKVDFSPLNSIVIANINTGVYLSLKQLSKVRKEISNKYKTDLIKINYESGEN